MPRTISCFTNAYGPFGVRVAVERIRDAGINHLELALRGHDFGGLVIPEEVVVTEKADDATATAFCNLMRSQGVLASGCNVGGGDLRTTEGLELTERRMRFAKRWFSAPIVVTNAGHAEDDTQRQTIFRHLRQIGDLAETLSMHVALETHKGLTQNADAMLALMAAVDHPHVGINFDTGNIAYYNDGVDPADELERVAKSVRNVHLKDNRGRFEDWYFPALGDGHAVNFRRVREILDAEGYAGAYTIEIEGIGGEPEPGLDGRQDRIRRSVDHLRSAGYFE
jgi:inosose dehydratase